MTLELVTVNEGAGPLMLPDGVTPVQGQIKFTAPPLVAVPGSGVFGGDRVVEVVDGRFSIGLVPSNLAGENPSGWPYRADASLTNAPDWTQFIRLDHGMGTVGLDEVVVPDASGIVYVAVSGLNGTNGTNGVNGKSAYELAVQQGFVGTLDEWLASLVGPPGADGTGGGGVQPVWYDTDLNLGVVVLHPQSSWVNVPGVVRTVTGVVPGDKVKLSTAFLRIGTSMQLDARFVVNGVPGRAISAKDDGVYTQGDEGFAPWYAQLSYDKTTGTRTMTVRAGDISSDGSVTLQMIYKGVAIPDDGSHHLYFGSGYLGVFDVEHWPVGAR